MQLLHHAGAFALLAALSGAASPAYADSQDIKAGTLVISAPWTRATPPGAKVAGGYFTVANKGSDADELTGGSFAVANDVQVHQMSMDGGVMKMERLNSLPIPAGSSVTLEPGGKHMMFIGLKHGLKKGEHIDGTLTFKKAGTVKVSFEVMDIAAKSPGGADAMPGMKMN